ncbi:MULTISPECIES: encapsulin nanocompartment cargo protein EncB [Myxococcus]|uniref:encapsulin nanocompartment cargo protein EncB n=1 Tax=Myxococcus TaxID=32 RepID=UPI0013D4AA99|nr:MULTISPECIES: encapsulin nanocompartment cargo protein EncB [Myxococcus]NOK04441.1 ferritin [Myxococcus xanthus]
MAGPPDSDLDDVARIRLVLARELETINEYEAYARASSNPEVRAFFQHLAAEEKEHVSEAVHMLRMLDSGQNDHFAKPFVPGHFQAAEAPAPATVHVPAPDGPAFSVNGRNGRLPSEPPTSLPPQRLLYGLPAPPPAVESHPLTVGSLRRGGGGSGSGR